MVRLLNQTWFVASLGLRKLPTTMFKAFLYAALFLLLDWLIVVRTAPAQKVPVVIIVGKKIAFWRPVNFIDLVPKNTNGTVSTEGVLQ